MYLLIYRVIVYALYHERENLYNNGLYLVKMFYIVLEYII